MGFGSLRDKLLQAGLVTEEQAKKADADREAERRRRADRGPKPKVERPEPERRPMTEAEQIAAQEAAAQAEHERFLAKERDENRRRANEDRKRQERLRSIAETTEVKERGEEAFHFASRRRKILRVYLTPGQVQLLETGQLAIIEKPLPAEIAFSIVPRATAEEALGIDERAVRFYNRSEGQTFGFTGDAATARAAPAAGDATDAEGTTQPAADEPPPATPPPATPPLDTPAAEKPPDPAAA